MRSIMRCGWLLLASFLSASAQTITVDGDDSDWTTAQLAPVGQTNIGQIARDAAGNGQYIWSDRVQDERTNFTTPARDPRVDIEEVRITGDATNLYVMVRIVNIISGPPPLIQLSVDTNRISGSGTDFLGGFSDTQISPDAYWERLLLTRFGEGQPNLRVWDDGFSNERFVGANAISDGNDVIEFSIPWAELGITDPSAVPLRFTLSSFRADLGNTQDIPGEPDILDAISNYGGDPGAILNTFDDTGDGVLDYYFDLYFDSDGDAISPVLISEVMYDPTPTATNEYVELYNLTSSSLDLTGWVLSDEETIDQPTGAEGAEQFDRGSITANGSLVIARDAAAFNGLYGFSADLALDVAGDFSTFSNWFTGGTAGSIDLDIDDEVFLLDSCQTIVDVVAFGSAANWPGVLAPLTASAGSSIERVFADVDTDDITADFTVVAGGNPGDFAVFPVEWAYFEATPLPQGPVRLSWATHHEVNNWQFVVERSADGRHFEALGRREAAGKAAHYAYEDAQPLVGVNYYRIRQIDFDGASSVSELAMVRLTDQQVAVYPNPVRDRLHVDLRLSQTGPLRLWLSDMQGRPLRTLYQGEAQAGPHALRFDLQDLPAGAYLLQGQGAGLRLRQPLLHP